MNGIVPPGDPAGAAKRGCFSKGAQVIFGKAPGGLRGDPQFRSCLLRPGETGETDFETGFPQGSVSLNLLTINDLNWVRPVRPVRFFLLREKI
ncbi:MAG: hypothetical protein JWM59_387 [Verrucomicrobiales bacterium]|nr:hypothetical protein [Verrucomicrobiales bacterium]